MRTTLLLLLALAHSPVASAQGTLEKLEQEMTALFEKAAPTVVLLRTREGFGSGFFVSETGLIVTNAHVVEGDDAPAVIFRDGREVKGRVVERAPDDLDVALVQAEGTGPFPALIPGPTDHLTLGTWVAAIGHGHGGVWTYTTGMVTNIYPVEGRRGVFQTQIPINPGNSGGPVLDREGHVVGIVTAQIKDANLLNFAIRVDEAVRALPALAAASKALTIHAPPGAQVFLDGKRVGLGPDVRIMVRPGKHTVLVITGGRSRTVTLTYPKDTTVDLR